MAAAVDLPTATDAPGSMRSSELPAAINTMNAARKVLRSMGWDDAWIDGVVGEIRKGKLQTSAEQIEAIVRRVVCVLGQGGGLQAAVCAIISC